MRIKHTFLLTTLLGLGWVGVMFARVAGGSQVAGTNGVFSSPSPSGVYAACSCHAPVSNVNTMLVSNLPDQWTPGAEYLFDVVVPSGAVRYGFGFSAVFDASTTQAGTVEIAQGGAPATLSDFGGIRFAVHDGSGPGNTFKVKWTAPDSGGNVRFNIGAVGGTGNPTPNSSGDFNYTQAKIAAQFVGPTLSSLNPSSGVQGSNVNIQLSGTGFVDGMTVNAGTGITVSNVNVGSAVSASATFAIASNATLGARNVTVTTSGGTSGATTFTVNSPPAPSLSALNPSNGTQGSSVDITLTGTGFLAGMTINAGNGITVSNVNVGSAVTATATFGIASNATLGARNVTVTTGGGTSGAATFTVNSLPLPSLSAMNPSSGAQGSSVNVTFTGTGFLAPMTINAGSGITVSNVNVGSAVSATATFAIASNAALGPRNVTVTTGSGTSPAATFTVNVPVPSLSGVNPSTGVQGSTVNVALTGTGFLAGMTVNAGSGVAVSNVNVGSAVSATATFAIASNAVLGARNVTVETTGGTSGSATFTVNPGPPSLTGITPSTAGQGSSVNVAFAGTGFAAGMTVNAGAGITISNLNVVSATNATATFAIAANAAVGTRSITVSVSSQTSNAFTFNVVTAFPDLSITSTHVSNFGVGFNEAYTIGVNNAGALSTTGMITVSDALPPGLVPSSATGTGWNCVIASQNVTCTSTTAVGPGASSTTITLRVNVTSAAASTVTHAPTVATTGDLNSSNNSAADVTTVLSTPTPTFVFSPATLAAGQQATVGLTLAAPFPHAVTGTLTLSFSSNAAIPADDPAIQFATGGRQAAFTIAANASQARFTGNAAEGPVGFQTGTVAGTFGFMGTLQAGTVQTGFSPPPNVAAGLAIPLAPPSIQSVRTDTQNGFAAIINLWSTMREVTQLSLTFNTTPAVRLSCGSVTGCAASGNTMTFDVKAVFDLWFNSTSAFGSLSALRMPLLIQGSIDGTVSVTLRNSQGVSNSVSFALP